MNLIRHRQRTLTAISPHQGNRAFIVPKRQLDRAPVGEELQLQAGDSGALVGYRFDFGDLTPDVFNGETISQLTEFDGSSFLINFNTEALGADFIGGIRIAGLYDLDAADADYSTSIIGSQWEWVTVPGGLTSGQTYTVTIF